MSAPNRKEVSNTQPAISIIVPIYDVEAYLGQCVDSLLAQSMRNIECILVDDGSPDNCGELCDRYANRDPRVRVIHQTNRGLSDARNVGMAIARGKYIMFVDSDDWVEPGYCQLPYELAERHGADLVIFDFRKEGTAEAVRPRKETARPQEGPLTNGRALQLLIEGNTLAVWNKLYRRDLVVGDLAFPSGKVHEDTAFTPYAVRKARCIHYLPSVLYVYRAKREGSITTLNSRKTAENGHETSCALASDLRSWGYIEEADRVEWGSHWHYLTSAGTKADQAEESIMFLLKKRQPKSATWKTRTMIALLRLSPSLFDLTCGIFGKHSST